MNLFSIVVIENSVEHKGKKAYKCNVCGFTSHKMARTREHQFMHTARKAFQCEYCGKRYSWPRDAKKHSKLCKEMKYKDLSTSDGKKEKHEITQLLADGKRRKYDTIPSSAGGKKIPSSAVGKKILLKTKFKCSICGQEFLEKNACKWHLSFCRENWKTKKVLEEYLNPGNSWQCSFCGDKFVDDKVYLRHSANCSEILKEPEGIKKKIAVEETDILRCKLCGKVCPNKGVWVKHTKYCSLNVKTQKIVQNLLEFNEKTFECYFCHKRFANNEDSRNHLASCSQISDIED